MEETSVTGFFWGVVAPAAPLTVTTILREIQELCNSLVSFSLCYTYRGCNLAAHVLAKQVSSVCVMGEWHQAPSCVQRYLESDCNFALDQ